MTDEEIMQQALEALENFARFQRMMMDGPDVSDKLLAEDYAEAGFLQGAKTITALRLRLAQPEQKPRQSWKTAIHSVAGATDSTAGFYPADGGSSPPRQATEQPEQEPEPVGEMRLSEIIDGMVVPVVTTELPVGTKLYIAPPQRKPLTKDEIRDGGRKTDPGGEDLCHWSFECGVRFAEAEHGIKEDA